MANYPFLFGGALLICIGFTFRSSDYYKKYKQQQNQNQVVVDDGIKPEQKIAHNKILKKYLIVYLLATFSDWLQGPYVYALYMAYGFEQHEIAQLFVAGFGSSMIFGSFVGGMADWGGRRSFVILFAMIYGASCITKHFNNYGILMLGRLLGGIATSLLFSVFEAWLIRAHSDADLPKSCISKSFSWAQFGNSSIAIVAGLLANNVANISDMNPSSEGSIVYFGGFLAPFDLALVALIACGTCAYMLWYENYGETTIVGGGDGKDGDVETGISKHHDKESGKWYDGLRNALTTTMRNRDILLCGIISSLFEGSMYIFVFMWTPLLKAFLDDPKNDDLPFGVIFATFMVCCMTGSSIFSIVVEKYPVEKLGIVVFGVAAVGMAIVALGISETVSFVGMNLFEVTVGLYFPIMGTMKGGIVPEDKRAAIYNLYRIPLNFIVLFSLLTDIPPRISFMLNAIMLSVATALQTILAKRRLESGGRKSEAVTPTKDVESEVVPLVEKDGSGDGSVGEAPTH